MTLTLLLGLSLAPLLPATAPPQKAQPEKTRPGSDGRITFEQAGGKAGAPRLDLSPSLPRWRWAPDGVHLIGGRGEETVWLDPTTGAEVEPKTASAEGAESPGLDELALTIEQAIGDSGVEGYAPKTIAKIAKQLATRAEQKSDDGGARMAYIDEELWFYSEASGARVLERGSNGEIRYDRLSPDGAWLTFVRDNDLNLIDTSNGTQRALTSGGGPDQFNGVLDWVYQEEIYGRGDFLGNFWAPDSKHTAYIALDESPVHEFTVVDHIEEGHFRVKPEVTNYPKVGDPNPIPSVGIAGVADGATAWVDLSAYDGQEILIVRVGWTPDGARCLVHVQDRIQTWADLLSVDPESGAATVLIRETSNAWTERPEAPIWLTDGSFLWHSHRTGTTHLYHYAADGTLIRPVTQGDWNMRRVVHVREEQAEGEAPAGHLWFDATEGGDIDTHLYRVALDGTGFRRLTQHRGTHLVSFNDERTAFIDRWSSLTDPGGVQCCDADGNVLRELGRATVPATETYALGAWELHRVELKDGTVLDAALLKPKDFDPARSYAVWVSTYSGPAAPSVRNRWNSSAYNQFLAQNGILVLQANVRTSTSRGLVHTAALYRRMGLQEVSDMVEVVDWLTANPWADGSRVGITGYSFGGTMTANCLMRTDRFKLGVAGGGVYDWRMYDSIYTERYMRTPVDNLSGFEETSVLAQAKNLREGSFLHMHHGIMDDNVHVQNMFQMAAALMRAGKTNWGMMAYPQTRHGVRDRNMSWHSQCVQWDLICQHLLPGRGASPAGATSGSY